MPCAKCKQLGSAEDLGRLAGLCVKCLVEFLLESDTNEAPQPTTLASSQLRRRLSAIQGRDSEPALAVRVTPQGTASKAGIWLTIPRWPG